MSLVNIYDSLFRRTTYGVVTNNNWMTITTNGYDFASRLSAVSDSNVVVTYSYVTNSSLVSSVLFHQGGSTKLTTIKQYDLLARLTNIVNTPGGAGQTPISFAYSYNSANQRTRVVHADGSYWIYAYDSLGQVTTGEKYWSDNTPVAGQRFEYGFDDIGNRTFAGHGGDQDGANLRYETYTANNLNQYSQRTVPGYADILGSAATNAIVTVNNRPSMRKGNYYRTELALLNTGTALYSSITNRALLANGTNSDVLTNSTGNLFLPKTPEEFGYDLDGNMTNDGRWVLAWDAENRLVTMESKTDAPANSGRRLSFEYDWMGRRSSKTFSLLTNTSFVIANCNVFAYDSWNCIAELNRTNLNPVTLCTWVDNPSNLDQRECSMSALLALRTGDTQQFVALDGNENVRGLIDSNNGNSSANYDYAPHGATTEASGPSESVNRFRYSSQYADSETGWINYGLRYYTLHSWCNRDPIGELGGFNLSCLLDNDAVNKVDYLGLKWHVDRRGQPRADAWSDAGDSFIDLAKDLNLDEEDYQIWAQTTDSEAGCKHYSVPNTVYFELGSMFKPIDGFGPIPGWQDNLRTMYNDGKRKNFNAVIHIPTDSQTARNDLEDPNVYLWAYAGHGYGGTEVFTVGQLVPSRNDSLDGTRFTKFGIAFLYTYACGAALQTPISGNLADRLGFNYSPWQRNVARAGLYTGTWGSPSGTSPNQIIISPGTNRK